MFCPYCGKEIKATFKHCPFCGHPVKTEPAQNRETAINLRPKLEVFEKYALCVIRHGKEDILWEKAANYNIAAMLMIKLYYYKVTDPTSGDLNAVMNKAAQIKTYKERGNTYADYLLAFLTCEAVVNNPLLSSQAVDNPSFTEAKKLVRASADSGNVLAIGDIGRWGCSSSVASGTDLENVKLAAEAFDPLAVCSLGKWYAEGKYGLQEDRDLAEYFNELSAAYGMPYNDEAKRKFEKELSATDENNNKPEQDNRSAQPDTTSARKRFCTNCGAQLYEGVRFCNSCGSKVSSGPSTVATPASEPDKHVWQGQANETACPYCGCETCHPTIKTEVSGGYSSSKGCCGFILLGPLGLLCGSSKVRASNETWWNCPKCGKEFITRSAALDKMKSGAEAAVIASLICAFFTALCLAMEWYTCIIPIGIAAFRWYTLYNLPKEQANISCENLLGPEKMAKVKMYAVVGVVVFFLVSFLLKWLLWP